MIVELPYLLLQTCLYSVITYFMIWFEINAGEHPVCNLHAITVRPALQPSPAPSQFLCWDLASMIAPCVVALVPVTLAFKACREGARVQAGPFIS